ncbi:3083_t:CDS:1, partial [Dentiscutata erythropus]
KIPYKDKETDTIELPDDIIFTSASIQDLINFVYPNINSHIQDENYFVERGILAPTNSNIDMINDKILNSFSDNNI